MSKLERLAVFHERFTERRVGVEAGYHARAAETIRTADALLRELVAETQASPTSKRCVSRSDCGWPCCRKTPGRHPTLPNTCAASAAIQGRPRPVPEFRKKPVVVQALQLPSAEQDADFAFAAPKAQGRA